MGLTLRRELLQKNSGERDSDMISVSSNEYVIDFWSIICAWTGFLDTREIPYANLADYLSYAASSGYHPMC